MGLNQMWARILGVVFLVVGVIGFVIPSPLLGMFEVDMLHNLVHLVTGLLGLWAGFSGMGAYAAGYNKWFGTIYLVVAVLGFFDVLGSILAINSLDNWLHLVVGIVTAGIGFGSKS